MDTVEHRQRVTPGQHLAASTAAGVLPGSPNFSASRDTSGTAISLNVHMPSSSPKSCAWSAASGRKVLQRATSLLPDLQKVLPMFKPCGRAQYDAG